MPNLIVMRGRHGRIHMEQDVSLKVVAAINSMNKQGHDAHLYRHQGEVWVEIDQCMLASFHEIEQLIDGVHSFEELAELFKKRHAEVLDGLRPLSRSFNCFQSSRLFALVPPLKRLGDDLFRARELRPILYELNDRLSWHGLPERFGLVRTLVVTALTRTLRGLCPFSYGALPCNASPSLCGQTEVGL